MILTLGARGQCPSLAQSSVPFEIGKSLDAAFYSKSEDKGYFFREREFLKSSKDKIDAGYPVKIISRWKQLPIHWNTGIDAISRCEPQEKTIFFKGREYLVFQQGYPVKNRPQKLPGEFKNLPSFFHSNIDAAVYLSDNNTLYFFKGDQYVRLKNNRVEQGYPRKLPGEFHKLPQGFYSDVDAVLYRKGYILFYKKGQYIANKMPSDLFKEGGTD